MKAVFLLCLSLAVVLLWCSSPVASLRITNLPGLTTQPTFRQYSGYIEVDEQAGRSLFYWFVESQRNLTTDPLVLWLTGGPGCSGLTALLSENGPFVPNSFDATTLKTNPYSWNKISNVIYLESPAGVGFSFSNTTSDYHTGDVRTANDTYTFLLGFLKEFPQFANRAFWITGESYGGHYVPNLAKRIIEGNNAGGAQKINLQGFMVGNAWTYSLYDNAGAVETWSQRFFNPVSTTELIKAKCNLTDVGPLKKRDAEWIFNDATCAEAQNLAMKQMGNVDIYDLYVDVCNAKAEQKYWRPLAAAGSPVHRALLRKAQEIEARQPRALDPCIDDHVTTYLNQANVQEAIHAKPMEWQECSSVVVYDYADIMSSKIPEYEWLFQQNIHMLVYTGDVDGIVPATGTRAWMSTLDLSVKRSWAQWLVDGQVGGYSVQYDKMWFSTVRNAGHMVPWYQPARAYVMFQQFLENQALPDDS